VHRPAAIGFGKSARCNGNPCLRCHRAAGADFSGGVDAFATEGLKRCHYAP